jgi:nicotinate dehydrogenase subunit B
MSGRVVIESPSRRRFLAAGSITVGFTLLPAASIWAQTTTEAGTFNASEPDLPGSLKTTPVLDAWIKVDADSRITVFTGKAELGTGIRTAFLQIAAEELGVSPERLTLVTADTSLTPNEGYTAGSHSTADSGTAIAHAAAQVRQLLIQAAATRLDVDVASLVVEQGGIVAADGRRLSFGEAVSGTDLHRRATPGQPTKDPGSFGIVGRPYPRVDIPGKVTGGASYVQDMRLPAMVHARVVRPPSYGATLASVDLARIRSLPGVVAVIRDGSYLAVAAEDEWQAIVAMRELSASATWNAGPPLPDPATLYDTLLKLPAQEISVANRKSTSTIAAKTLHARFTKPYLTHGSMGPSCALAQFDGTQMTVWTHTQGVFPLRKGIAEMLSMKPEHVRCVHVEGAGCYGHNGADDVAADAALIAHALPGRPVRVQWMREQEHMWEPFGPAMITDVAASLDDTGHIVDWRFEIWSNTHNNRIENAGRLMPTWFLAKPFTPAPPKPIPMPEGGGDRNSIPLYRIPNVYVQHHFLPEMPIRVSAMRSLGAYHNVFSIESFIDELAAAAGADPVDFRLRHLDDPRAQDVIRRAAQRFGWERQPASTRWRGRGFSFAQYKNLMAYCAIAAEVSVEPDTGRVTIERIVSAVDCGQIVNPDGVRNQIEGGIVQSASWTLFEETTFDRHTITSFDWSTYPILRFESAPRAVDVELIDRPGQPFLGVGEAAQGPMAAALANAIAHATGVRFRALPMSPARLRAALEARA